MEIEVACEFLFGLFPTSQSCVIHRKLLPISGGNSYLDFDFLPKTENFDFTCIWNICSHLDLTGKAISLFGTKACCTLLDQNIIKPGSWVMQNERKTKVANFFCLFVFSLLTTLLQFSSKAFG